MRRFLPFLIALFWALPLAAQGYVVRGVITNSESGEPMPYATVTVEDNPQRGAVADSLGRFAIRGVEGGERRFVGSSLGFAQTTTPTFFVGTNMGDLTIMLTPDERLLQAVIVTPDPQQRIAEAPLSVQRLTAERIDKSAGANRDVSRVVQTLPGVGFSPVGYRNDLIIRGGAPSENGFYVDGFRVPTINHFSTQGASGGPVGLINGELVREIDLYSGAFPASQGGALSAILDIKLKNGYADSQRFSATLGASEAALSAEGHFGERWRYIFSVRQSYLQLLFKLLGLPFLPNYIDGLAKVEYSPNSRNRLSLMILAAIDDMTINDAAEGERAQYIAGYIPKISQQIYTVGAKWRHFNEGRSVELLLSSSLLDNQNVKYRDNIFAPQNLLLDLASRESFSQLKLLMRNYLGEWTLRYGAELNFQRYTIDEVRAGSLPYSSMLPLWGGALFGSATYSSPNELFTSSIGVRFDCCDYSKTTSNLLRHLSPRLSLSYDFSRYFTASAGGGVYYQLPPLTALGYLENGQFVNCDLPYMRVISAALGLKFRSEIGVAISAEGFTKFYNDLPLSVATGVPLSDVGNDYGVVGNEQLTASAEGRAYGVELLARYRNERQVDVVGSLTLFRSQVRAAADAPWRSAAWDNGYIFNASGTYNLPRKWDIGLKISSIGGAPFTPYDEEGSALVGNWLATFRPQLDYGRYNEGRLGSYTQVDLRVDKRFDFVQWSLLLYLDIQNILGAAPRSPDILVATDEIEDSTLPPDSQRFVMRSLAAEDGSRIPTLGVTARF